MLFLRASKIMLKENPASVPEQAAAVVKALEPLCEQSKVMSNLKGKLREVKELVKSA